MLTTTAAALQPWQKRIIVTAWLTYAAYYLGRANLSAVMPALQADLDLTKSEVGLLSSGLFWAYTLGQLVNGLLGDHFSPRRFVFFGALVSVGLNLLFGSLSVLPALLLVWTLNGYFQATGWGPILRTLANWLTPEQRTRVSSVFGSSFVVGGAVTWLLAGWLAAHYGWRAAFWVPAVLFGAMVLVWYTNVPDSPQPEGSQPARRLSVRGLATGLAANLRHSYLLVAACVFLGFPFAALAIWLPTFFAEAGNLDVARASAVATLTSASGLGGTLFFGWLIGRLGAGRETAGLAVVTAAFALVLFGFRSVPDSLLAYTLGLFVVGAFAYGAASILLTTMPLVVGGREEASSAAGLLDLSFGIGSSFSGGLVGLILDRSGWDAVFAGMAASAALSALLLLAAMRFQGARQK